MEPSVQSRLEPLPGSGGRSSKCSFALALALTCWLPAAGWAQDPTMPAPTPPPTEEEEAAADTADEVITETITVTSRKREEDLQEVPLSVSAPSEALLRSRGAEDMEGVSLNVAGFTVQNLGPGQSQVAMRGISAGQIVRDQPGVKEQVGVYLDESVISMSLFTPDIDLFDMSRVEALRGPQGTLFGSGSFAGTVRYITNPPEIGRQETVAEFTVSSIDGGDIGGSVKAAVNVPVGDTTALRVAAYYTSYGGFTDAVQPNLSVKEDVNSGDRAGIRLALRMEPNESLTVTPRIIYQEVNMDGWNRQDAYNILANPFTTTRPAVTLGEHEIFTQLDESFTDEFLLADLNIGYDFGGVALTSVTSYTDRDVLVVRDTTSLTASVTGGTIGLPANVFLIDSPLFDATTAQVLSQEFRLNGGDDNFNWVGGVFYSDMDRDYGQQLPTIGFSDTSGIDVPQEFAPRDVLFFSDLSYEFKQLAAFGEATWAITDRFDLTGGVRYYDFDEDRSLIFDGLFADKAVQTGSTTADGFAPRVILAYALSDATTLNAQVSKGFRLGGINDPLNVPLCTPDDLVRFSGQDTWEDETLWNYEIGSKSRIAGGRGTFNVAVYHADIEDLQATATAGSCSSRIIFNVPEAQSTGIDLELAVAPNPSFDFAIAASYNDSELGASITAPDGTVVAGIEEGRRLPTVPEFQMSAAATLQRPIGTDWLGYSTVTYQHVGSRFTQIGDQAAGFGTINLRSFDPNNIGGPYTQNIFTFDPELPAYDLINLRFGVLYEKWDVALFVNNVTDELALTAIDQERGSRARLSFLTNQPRTFGISTRVSF